MKFKTWLNEDQQEIPDAKSFAYIGCVLHRHSQIELLNTIDQWMGGGLPRRNWTGRCHHMTNFPPGQFKQENMATLPWGEDVQLNITGWAADQYGVTATVKPAQNVPFASGQTPHITVAHSFEVKPVYSISLLGEPGKWKPSPFSLTVTSYFLGVMHNQTSVWPAMGSLLLASPSIPLGGEY